MRHVKLKVFLACVTGLTGLHAAEPQISAGRYHNLALTSDGTVYWWGTDAGARIDLREKAIPQSPTVVRGLPAARAIAAGWTHSVAVGDDGGVYEWGSSPYRASQQFLQQRSLGICELARLATGGHGKDPCAEQEQARARSVYTQQPLRVTGVPAARQVAASDKTTLMISRTGSVYCWNPGVLPRPVEGLEQIKEIAMGQFHAIALREDGAVLTWGDQNHGQLGRASQDNEMICGSNARPQVIFTHATHVAAGVDSSYVLDATGNLWGWGNPWSDQLGLRTRDRKTSALRTYAPQRIRNRQEHGAIAAGGWALAQVTQAGELLRWGTRLEGVAGTSSRIRESVVPLYVPPLEKIDKHASYDRTLVLTAEGFVCAWGNNTYGEVRLDSNRRVIADPVPIFLADGKMPLNLLPGDASSPDTVCADRHWRDSAIPSEEEIDKKRRQARDREDGLVKALKLPTPNGSYGSFEWAISGNDSALKTLLETGEFDINAPQDDKGETILHRSLRNYAGRSGLNGRLSERLLDHGANALLRDKNAMTTLMLAAEHQGPELLTRLKGLGVPINATSADGSTALMYAVAGRRADNVKLLLGWGADAGARNLSGDTAWSVAQYQDDTAIMGLLQATADGGRATSP